MQQQIKNYFAFSLYVLFFPFRRIIKDAFINQPLYRCTGTREGQVACLGQPFQKTGI